MDDIDEATITVPARVWHALEARLEAVERELERVGRGAAPSTVEATVETTVAATAETTHSRRGALRLAGATAVGAAGAALVAGRAAADFGFNGSASPVTYTLPVRNVSTVTTANLNAFVFASSTTPVTSNADAEVSAALAGWAYASGGAAHGVYG